MTTVNRLHERESKTVLDSKFHSLESDHQILDSRFPETVEVGFKIPIVSGIPDSLSLFRILQANIYWILETLLDLTWGDHTLWVILTKSFRYLVT